MKLVGIWLTAMTAWAAGPNLAEPGLKLEILEGDGAVLNLRSRSVAPPRVRVSDPHGLPAAGAFVTFRLPDAGPGAAFAEGRIATVTADEKGEAAAPAMKLNSQLGPWEIRIAAAHHGLVARASLQQISAAPVEAIAGGSSVGGGSSKRSRNLYWVAAVAAGAAAAATVGLTRGGNATARSGGVGAPGAALPSASAPPLAISAGAGSAGAP